MVHPKPKVIIDTDCGTDDAFGILYALENYDVVAITCVSGNTHVDNVCNNVGVVLELANKPEVPIYRGCADYIINRWRPSEYKGHGEDGLGDLNLTTKLVPNDLSAVDALIELTKIYNVHLITLGPLTNIALATLIDPQLAKRIVGITVMGGAHQCKGNVNLAGEFNVHCDPEAAHIVFQRYKDIRLVTWETGYKNHISWDTFESWGSTPYGKFMRDISHKVYELHRGTQPGLISCDLIAVASLLCEESCKKVHGQIELSGTHTRGATIFDWTNNDDLPRNVKIIKINKEVFLEQVTELIG